MRGPPGQVAGSLFGTNEPVSAGKPGGVCFSAPPPAVDQSCEVACPLAPHAAPPSLRFRLSGHTSYKPANKTIVPGLINLLFTQGNT